MPSPVLRHRAVTALLSLALGAGCAGGGAALGPADYDRPVPASEPRAELGLEVDLLPARDCEERFDLALYRHRAVDLIAWDPRRGRCIDRQLSVRYLSGQISAEQLLERVRELTKNVRRLPTATTDAAGVPQSKPTSPPAPESKP
jgi:hypothetical protein